MFEVRIDKPKNLVTFFFSGRVTPDETSRMRTSLKAQLAQLKRGFSVLSDFSQLDFMDLACAPDVEFAMDACDKAGTSKVVRLIPDARKDIGFSIMSLFHYHRRIPIVTCETLAEAVRALEE
ncbi:MAG TPA: hypothetical protein VN873_06195 [Candidatus Angelobacter sp.]|nr:hypothetical protein [Candidatus Angelobacter sp.]